MKYKKYHTLENRDRIRTLAKLSERQSFTILNSIHLFCHEAGAMHNFSIFDTAKIKTLVKVHSIFGKVKS